MWHSSSQKEQNPDPSGPNAEWQLRMPRVEGSRNKKIAVCDQCLQWVACGELLLAFGVLVAMSQRRDPHGGQPMHAFGTEHVILDITRRANGSNYAAALRLSMKIEVSQRMDLNYVVGSRNET